MTRYCRVSMGDLLCNPFVGVEVEAFHNVLESVSELEFGESNIPHAIPLNNALIIDTIVGDSTEDTHTFL